MDMTGWYLIMVKYFASFCFIQCNLDLVTQKLSLNRIMSLNRTFLYSKMKNGLYKIVTKSQIVTKFNVTESRLLCTLSLVNPKHFEFLSYLISFGLPERNSKTKQTLVHRTNQCFVPSCHPFPL